MFGLRPSGKVRVSDLALMKTCHKIKDIKLKENIINQTSIVLCLTHVCIDSPPLLSAIVITPKWEILNTVFSIILLALSLHVF